MHSCSRPSRQPSQRPQACDGDTATLSPFFTRVTPWADRLDDRRGLVARDQRLATTKLPLRPSK